MDIDALQRLVREAGFVFRGRPLEQQHGERLPAGRGDSERVVVRIEAVLRSTDALRGLAGRDAVMETKEASALRPQQAFVFFVQVLSLGQNLLGRELGHAEATDETLRRVEQAIREEDERPLRERVAAAELIVVGEVVESRVLERPFPPPSEHYADWGIARVAVSAVLKGHKPQGDVTVLFAASDDRVWFHSPKLHVGVRGILLLFRVDPGEQPPRELPRDAYQALDPLDLQPVERREEIKRLAGGGSGRGER